MGNSTSTLDREEIGERIFEYAKQILHDKCTDDAKLEKITGMVLDSSQNLDQLDYLLKNDTPELDRRIIISNSLFEEQSNVSASKPRPNIKPTHPVGLGVKNRRTAGEIPRAPKQNHTIKRQELINLFEREYPSIDSTRIADELLELSDKELTYVISTPDELRNFIKSSSSKNCESDFSNLQGATACKLDSLDFLNK